jgi:hypothetical protein
VEEVGLDEALIKLLLELPELVTNELALDEDIVLSLDLELSDEPWFDEL